MNAHVDPLPTAAEASPDTAKPRIALMGEFSAGKSTLANLMMEQAASPVKVTATQLPPIWYSYGTGAPRRVDNHGQEHALGADGLNGVSHADTRCVRVFVKAEVLSMCDLIDMPGTSDPNMAADVWQNMLDEADGVVWCTPATQAWRQSEAAVWDEMPERIRDHGLLLITRFDKLTTARDRVRVINRVSREVDGSFLSVLPISLTMATDAGQDPDIWAESGAEAFGDRFVTLLAALETRLQGDADYARASRLAAAQEAAKSAQETDFDDDEAPADVAHPAPAPERPAPRPVPERIARPAATEPRKPRGIAPRRITPRA